MSKLYRYLVAGAITAVVLFLVWYFSNVVAYILVSAVLAIIGKPLTDLLSGLHVRRTRFPRSLAALCTLLAIWVIVQRFDLFRNRIDERKLALADRENAPDETLERHQRLLKRPDDLRDV